MSSTPIGGPAKKLIVLTSPDVVAPNGAPDADVVSTLISIHGNGNPSGTVSNSAEPAWFKGAFGASGVEHLHVPGRQDGRIVVHNAQSFGLQGHNTIVLAGKQEDLEMGKNGGAVLVAAGWCNNPRIGKFGIQVKTPAEFAEVVALTSAWSGAWWFEGQGSRYSVRALSDLSGINQPVPQQYFALRIKALVKNGGPRLMALLTVTARSLLISAVGGMKDLVFGVFPSSSSANNDTEVLSEFTHRLRTTVSRVRWAKELYPLFVRHTPTAKRSAGGTARMDPAPQVETLHLNPEYKGKLHGRNVVVVDDCTTYGLSFGVAAAFLRKAGAESVMGVALGKFGNQMHEYEIDIETDPFAPVVKGGYTVGTTIRLSGTSDAAAQQALIGLLR